MVSGLMLWSSLVALASSPSCDGGYEKSYGEEFEIDELLLLFLIIILGSYEPISGSYENPFLLS